MPVEIREIIIKTEVRSSGPNNSFLEKEELYQKMKMEILEECRKLFLKDKRIKNNRR